MKNERNGSAAPANLSVNKHSGNSMSDAKKDFMKTVGLVLRRKWEVVGILLTTTLIAVLIAVLSTPLYLAQGTLVMERSGNDYMAPGSDLGNLLAKNYGLGMSSNVDAEVQLLQSSRLAVKVAQKLLAEKYDRNGKLYPIIYADYPNDSVLVSIDTVAFRISQKLDIKKDQLKGDMVYISYESPSRLEAERLVNVTFDIYAELSGEQKRTMTRSAMEFLANEQKRVQQKLGEDEDALKKFMDQKGIVEVEGQTSEVIRSISQLEDAKQGLNVKQVSANSAIEKFQQQLNALKPGLSEQYAAAVGPTIDRYQYRLAELETEKLLILSRNPGYENQPDAIPEVKRINEQMESLRNEIRKITSQLAKNSEELLSVPGGQADAAKEVMDLNRRLIQLKVEQSQYQAQSNVIAKQLSQQRSFFQKLPENMVELARLKRNVEQNEKLYKNIAEQYAETALWAETRLVAGRPVDKANVSDLPVKPNKKLLIFSGLIVGLIGSIGYILLRESLRIKIDGIDQMKNKPYPLLGIVPDLDQERKQVFSANGTQMIVDAALSQSLLSLHDPLSHFAESCRRLRNNILYSQHENDFKVVAITSPDMGDGKSTVVANLAVSLAEAGRQIVIIDADLRRPNAHNFFGMNISPGLNEVLSGKTEMANVVRETPVPSISLISAGAVTDNPAALIEGKKMKDLIDRLRAEFDHILIDTPPFGLTVDSASLIKQANGVLVVARFNKTSETEFDQTLEELGDINAHIIGTVLTAFDHSKSADNYYGSKYGSYSTKKYSGYYKRDK